MGLVACFAFQAISVAQKASKKLTVNRDGKPKKKQTNNKSQHIDSQSSVHKTDTKVERKLHSVFAALTFKYVVKARAALYQYMTIVSRVGVLYKSNHSKTSLTNSASLFITFTFVRISRTSFSLTSYSFNFVSRNTRSLIF